MSPGKAIAQAGHAYMGALKRSQALTPQAYHAYTSLDVATKICLNGRSEDNLIHCFQRLSLVGIPAFLVYDSGHIELPYFDGSSTLTALGVGPIARADTPGFLKKLKLWSGLPDPGGAP
jgi:peptidyl-tRNA hydrolase